jgi:hypothetical protein
MSDITTRIPSLFSSTGVSVIYGLASLHAGWLLLCCFCFCVYFLLLFVRSTARVYTVAAALYYSWSPSSSRHERWWSHFEYDFYFLATFSCIICLLTRTRRKEEPSIEIQNSIINNTPLDLGPVQLCVSFFFSVCGKNGDGGHFGFTNHRKKKGRRVKSWETSPKGETLTRKCCCPFSVTITPALYTPIPSEIVSEK